MSEELEFVGCLRCKPVLCSSCLQNINTIAQLKSLAQSAEDDCQRAIGRASELRLDLKCLEESTVDSKAYATLTARVAELEGAVSRAATTFRQYEKIHADKGTLAGDSRARTNAVEALYLEAALTTPAKPFKLRDQFTDEEWAARELHGDK